MTMRLGRYSIGVGDRFVHQAEAQLRACIAAHDAGVDVIPVWNKSNREHTIIGSEPESTRVAADRAVAALGWSLPYFCDADHINLSTVERFLPACDFFTIDVAVWIGKAADDQRIEDFIRRHDELLGTIALDGSDDRIEITPDMLRATATHFLSAVEEAGKIYRKIEAAKGKGNFIPEISMDETDVAQSPGQLLIILAAIADEAIPVQTIAPKFSGRFNKGVDFVGDVTHFAVELALDMSVVRHAIESYSLPDNLKLSIHSGSDKFSIYPAIYQSLTRFGTGVHLKTAGTTWLEEVTGLAEAEGEGLALAKEIYAEAFSRSAELCAPYSSVIDIDSSSLPSPAEVGRWSSGQFNATLRNHPGSASFNPSFRQLLHVGFKVAAKLGPRYIGLLESYDELIGRNVAENLFSRHIAPVFLGKPVQLLES
jgi:hypothetical protein